MEAIPAKEFLEKINSGNLKPSAHIFGKVKKSDKKTEVMFAFKSENLKWIRIPASMIDHVHVIKSFKMEGEDVSLAKMKLNAPDNDEAKVLYDLLLSLSEKLVEFWEMKKMMWHGGEDWKEKNSLGHKGSEENSCHHHWH